MQNKIVFLDESTINLNGDVEYHELGQLGDFISYSITDSDQQIIERAKEATHLIVNKVKISKAVLDSLPKLRNIAVIATGFNNIDVAHATKVGVQVSNVPGYAKGCVPQHIFALILNLATKVHLYNEDIKNGEWKKSPHFTLLTYPTFELAGKIIGIIGFGAIGQSVAKIAEAFGMKVMMNRRSGHSVGKYVCHSLDKIFKEADVVNLSCPLTDENQHMINAQALKKMKSSALLINTARGPLVDQQALADALNNNEIAGAGIDVLDEEPPKNNPLLAEVKNLILSPHSAWSTVEARQRLIDEVAENIQASLAGGKRNLVN